VGGFGTVAWVDVKEYEKAHPDTIAANGAEQTLKVNLSHAVVSVRLSALTTAYFQPWFHSCRQCTVIERLNACLN
jgi:hypothetical protein